LMLLELFLDLFLYGIQVKACGRLHRRKFDGCLRKFRHRLLHYYKPPELAPIKVIHISATEVVEGLAADGRCSLERILPDVHDSGYVCCDFFPGQAVWLLKELEFKIIDANGPQMRPTKKKELMTSRWPCATKKSHLVITIKMILIRTVS